MKIEVPELLSLPRKLMPMVVGFNDYKYFLIEGGRGSGKTHGAARIVMAVADARSCRVVCGRETQNTIRDSVYTVFSDLIRDYELTQYQVLGDEIRHRVNGSTFRFKGFREQGSVNLKGMEGIDIVWVDEAQAVTKHTLKELIPTIRKNTSKLIFTMNRHTREDAVVEFLSGRPDCLHIKINYDDNPHCPETLLNEARECKERDEAEYRHIWLGEPLESAEDYLFNFERLYDSLKVEPVGEPVDRQRVIGIDFAAQGGDSCVATVLDRVTMEHYELVEQIEWKDPDGMSSVGKIVELLGRLKPDVAVLDVGGMGHVVHNRLSEVGLNIHRFDGGSTKGIDPKVYVNVRADGYYILKEWFARGWLMLKEKDKPVLKELEKIRFKYRSSGARLLLTKQELKKDMGGRSPDKADSLMMAVWGAVKFMGQGNVFLGGGMDKPIRRVVGSKRRP